MANRQLLTCPACAAPIEAAPVAGDIGICPVCARSVVLDGSMRLATGADLTGLTESQVKALRAARPRAWREAQRAVKARIKGR